MQATSLNQGDRLSENRETSMAGRGSLISIGHWDAGDEEPSFSFEGIAKAAGRIREQAYIVRDGFEGSIGVGFGGEISVNEKNGTGEPRPYPLIGILPPLYPEWLGDRLFCEVHGLRFPYVAGAMATGIGSAKIVIEMAKAGMMGFFGSAGLNIETVEKAIDEIQSALGKNGLPYGSNLIHSLNEPQVEEDLVDLYFKKEVKKADASAFMKITPAVVRYSVTGLHTDPAGNILHRNHLFAKISRPEVAEQFMSPPPAEVLKVLKSKGQITEEEAGLAEKAPLAEDIIIESDSGGHTDNRPLAALFTTIASLRDRLTKKYGYKMPIRLGAAGGIGTPAAVAAAFSLGASFVQTGSINQCSVEADTSTLAKEMIAKAQISDVMMAPAADMFELGVKVQVLKRGTMWGVRGQKLYECYRTYNSYEEIPEMERAKIERDLLRDSFANIWAGTKAYFEKRDPHQVARAEQDPKHKMALVFRWYLGMGSRWAIQGVKDRMVDYQIWCGPAQGAFNEWVKGSFLEPIENRSVVQIALNLMEGASVITRANQLRSYGVPVPEDAYNFVPRKLKI